MELGTFADGSGPGPILESEELGNRLPMPLDIPTSKSEYNIEEAARVLDMSAAELRSQLIRHDLDEPDGVRNLPKMRFRPADLIMLRLVCGATESS